jgi:sialic acid synthase SpsE
LPEPRKFDYSIPFAGRRIGATHPVLVIAEIGINHEGSAEACARMIEEAAGAGADAIKLQTVDADENYMPGTESHQVFSNSALSREETARMFDLARERGLEPFTTTGDFATLDWVDRLEPAAHKISSGLLTNLPLIRHAAATGRTLLMSIGMAEVSDIDAAVATVREGAERAFGLFQCTSIYPAPPETLNLAAIAWLERRYRAPAGFSDHALGIEAAAMAVAAGGRMIEKHFSLDSSRSGFDHHLSLEPAAFARMVEGIRAVETMMGSPDGRLSETERDNAKRLHRCLVARRDIAAGTAIGADDIGIMRVEPGRQGLAPRAYDEVLGRRVVRDLPRHTPIGKDDLA